MFFKEFSWRNLATEHKGDDNRVLKLPGNMEIETNLIQETGQSKTNMLLGKNIQSSIEVEKYHYEELQNTKLSDFKKSYAALKVIKQLPCKKYSQGVQIKKLDQQKGQVERLKNDSILKLSGVISVEFLKKANVLEVSYYEGYGDPKKQGYGNQNNRQQALDQLNMVILQIKRISLDNFQPFIIQRFAVLLAEYSNLLAEAQHSSEEEKIQNTQEFWIASKIAHRFLEQKKDSLLILTLTSTKKSYFFYEILKRTDYGFSSEKKGISQDLTNLLELPFELFSFKCLREGFPNFLTVESYFQLMEFHIQMRLAVLKNKKLDQFDKRKFIMNILTTSQKQIPCEFETEVLQISYYQNSHLNHYLLICHITPLHSEEKQEQIKVEESQKIESTTSLFTSQHSQLSENSNYESIAQEFLKKFYSQNF